MFFNKKQKVSIKEEKEFMFVDKGLHELIWQLKILCGVDLEQKKSILHRKIKIFCEQNQIVSFESLLSIIKYNNKIKQKLINLITVNETYFFRELPQLLECVNHIKHIQRPIRILSAPCATGEEVYSLAILAQKMNLENIFILGIDIDSQAIEDAKNGLFSERSLHNVKDNMKLEYFTKEDKKYAIKKELFSNVDFKTINIFDDEFLKFKKFDIIFSRNMMIYFDNEYKLKAIRRFYELLEDDGHLYTGHADLVPENKYFKKISKDRVYFYKKINYLCMQ